jgi:hypothetical protein
MTLIQVLNDPDRPFVVHRHGDPTIHVQVNEARVNVEIESAMATKRQICIHRLYRFFKNAAAESVCERDDVRFVAVKEHAHAH